MLHAPATQKGMGICFVCLCVTSCNFAARSDYHPESDIDILVLIPGKVDTSLKEEVIGLAYDIELEYDVVFGIVVRSKEFWASEKAAFMPFHQNVQREAVRV